MFKKSETVILSPNNDIIMKQSKLFWPLVVGLVLVLALGFLALTNIIGIWRIPELWSQIFAACTGSIVVAVGTMVLMHGQRATEERKVSRSTRAKWQCTLDL